MTKVRGKMLDKIKWRETQVHDIDRVDRDLNTRENKQGAGTVFGTCPKCRQRKELGRFSGVCEDCRGR